MSIFAIGDIHGCFDLLDKGFEVIKNRASLNDKIVLLGDIIDSGSDTKKCIDLILEMSQKYEVIAVKGNHEEWMLQTKDDYTSHSWIISMDGLKTIKSYSESVEEELKSELKANGIAIVNDHVPISYDKFFKVLPKAHLDFIENMRDYYIEGNYIFVHAGISTEYKDLDKMDRHNMRWGFEGFPEKYHGNKIVVYGHWSNKAVINGNQVITYQSNNTICIDTQKHNVLTIFIAPENKIVQITPKKQI